MSTQCGGRSGEPRTPRTWAVVNTQPNRERLALSNLLRQNFHVYCPMITRRIRHARRAQDVLRPLFPGYLFIEVDPDLQRWRPILSTFGVRTLIRSGDRPALLEDAFIEGIRAREIDGAIVRPDAPYERGQQVRMVGGAFDGLVATIIEMDEKDRLVVLMDLLNRPVKVRVEARLVAAA
jgi:transcriptional antiterminator RfaH